VTKDFAAEFQEEALGLWRLKNNAAGSRSEGLCQKGVEWRPLSVQLQ
jgi:hypothetical protein